jgi:hypothetical protein
MILTACGLVACWLARPTVARNNSVNGLAKLSRTSLISVHNCCDLNVYNKKKKNIIKDENK